MYCIVVATDSSCGTATICILYSIYTVYIVCTV